MNKMALVLGLFALPVLCAPAIARADAAAGEKMFKGKCGSCHGPDGKGKTKQGEKMKIGDMTSAAWKKQFNADKIKQVMTDGLTREKDGVKQEMKPIKGLTPEQSDDIAKHVVGLK